MRYLLLVAIAASALAVAAPSTQAATITDTASVAGEGFFDPGQDVLVPQFDTALGTLTNASASLTGQLTPGVVLTTNPPTPLPQTVTFTPTVSFRNTGYFLAPQTVAVQDLGAGNGQAIGTPDALDITAPLSLGSLPVSPIFPGNLDFYILASSVGGSLPAGAFFTIDRGVLNAQLAVTYTYTPANGGTPTPEPGSLALLGAGLIGLLGARHRRR